MESPRPELAAHLRAEFPGADLALIAGDASSRRFFRLRLPDGSTRVVMDYGAPFSENTDDLRLSRIFEAANLPVAHIEKALPEAGCLVLEDLGDRTLEAVLGELDPGAGARREELYQRAVALAAAVAIRGTRELARSDRAKAPVLDAERFRFEMDFFLEYYARGLRGLSSLSRELPDALHNLARCAADAPANVLCHRDFHSRNLMVREDGSLTMVDIQDARLGPDTYDIASLLRDAYVDLDEDFALRMREVYRTALPEPPSPRPFEERFHLTACQRMIKALGTFGYQVAVLGRQRYLSAIPRTVERLRRVLPMSPETARLGQLLGDASLLEE